MTPIELKEAEFKDDAKLSNIAVDKKFVAVSRTRVTRKVKSGMFDAPEIIAVSVAGVALLGVIFAYLFILIPAREEFKLRETERSQKQAQLADLQAKAKDAGSNAAGTIDLASSVDRFEANFLPLPVSGNAALYQRLNELIRANNLRNTAGPSYSSLEMVDAAKVVKTEDRRASAKQPGIFPGTYVTVTVEGNYNSLRHFISDLESTRQYLIINAVEIELNGNGESSSNKPVSTGMPDDMDGIPSAMLNNSPNSPTQPNKINPRLNGNPAISAPVEPAAASNQPKRGSVSLQLEMAAYFRRGSAPELIKTQN